MKKSIIPIILGQIVLDTIIKTNTEDQRIKSYEIKNNDTTVGGPPFFSGVVGFFLSQLFSWMELPLIYAYTSSKANSFLEENSIVGSLTNNLKMRSTCPHFQLIYNPNEKERTLFLENPPLKFDPNDFDWKSDSFPVAIVGSVFHEFNDYNIFSFLRKNSSYIAFDPQGCFRQLSQGGKIKLGEWMDSKILELIDCLKLSEIEARYLNLGNNNNTIINNLLDTSISTVLLTQGEKGAILGVSDSEKMKKTMYNIPGYTSNVVDETGAGDVFLFSFATHFCAHSNVLDAVAFSTSIASLLIEQNRFSWHFTEKMIKDRQQIIRSQIKQIHT